MIKMAEENKLSGREKVQRLYDLIGNRGLYVNTNYDIFSSAPEKVNISPIYSVSLLPKNSRAFSSSLLFATLTSLLNHGTMLITGAPGIGKTTGAEVAGHFYTGVSLPQILEAELIGNPQLKTEDVTATLDTVAMVHEGRKKVIPTKFLQCPVKIGDEINRTPSDLLSSAMKLVDTGKAVYQGELLESPPGVLFATANYSDEGTFQLPPPFLDRFDVAVMVTSPPPWDLKKIRQRGDEKMNGHLEKLLQIPEELTLNEDDRERIRKEISSISENYIEDIGEVSSFADFIYSSLRFSEAASDNLVRATKGNAWQLTQDNALSGHFTNSPFNYTLNELSIRTVQAMVRYAKAFAWINGKEKVELEDLKCVLPYLLWHKIQPTSQALTEHPKYANDRIGFVEDLTGKIETEYTELAQGNILPTYAVALRAVRDSKLRNKELDYEQVRNIVRNALVKIGNADKPYALTLASHIASEYNHKIMHENK